MKNDIIRQNISEHTEHGIIFTNPDFDNSIIGISIDGRVVYDYDLMVNEVQQDQNCSADKAEEIIDNCISTILYHTKEQDRPIIINQQVIK